MSHVILTVIHPIPIDLTIYVTCNSDCNSSYSYSIIVQVILNNHCPLYWSLGHTLWNSKLHLYCFMSLRHVKTAIHTQYTLYFVQLLWLLVCHCYCVHRNLHYFIMHRNLHYFIILYILILSIYMFQYLNVLQFVQISKQGLRLQLTHYRPTWHLHGYPPQLRHYRNKNRPYSRWNEMNEWSYTEIMIVKWNKTLSMDEWSREPRCKGANSLGRERVSRYTAIQFNHAGIRM